MLGGTGFLGAEIARRFLASGSAVTAVARHEPSDPLRIRLAGARFAVADAGDAPRLARLLDDSDHVVHAVGSTLPQESNAAPANDVTSTLPSILTLLDLLRRRPQVALTFISSGGTVYGNPREVPVSESAACHPITSYGVVKLAAEKYIGMYSALYGLRARILRVANVYGPGQPAGRSQGIVGTCLAAVQRGDTVRVFGDGRTVRDYIHVSDVATAVVELARTGGPESVVNVGSGVGHTILDLLGLIAKVSGVEPSVEFSPDRGFDVRAIVLDTTLLTSLIPWRPAAFEEGLRHTWNEPRPQMSVAAHTR